MTTVTMKTSVEGLVVGLSSTLAAIERTEAFRSETVDKHGAGTNLNDPIEWHLDTMWDYVEDLHKAFLTIDRVRMERTDADIAETWAKLVASNAARPWTTRAFGYMEMTAVRMGAGAASAKAA